MFRKLVSNLSFNPAVSTQLAFYARRLRGEDLTRRLSMLFGVGVLAFQFAAVVSPATSVNANGPNNVLLKGFSSKSDLIQQLNLKDDEHVGARALFDRLGIGSAEINAAQDKYIPARGNSKYSFGRNRMAASDIKRTVDAAGHTFYARPLSSVATTTNAHVLEGTTTTGQYFAVLFTCGNPLVSTLPPDYTAPAPPPSTPIQPKPILPAPEKTTLSGRPVNNAEVAPGTLLGYRISFKNTGTGAATNVFIEDSIPVGTTFVSIGTGGADRTDPNGHLTTVYPGHSTPEDHAYWAYYSMPAGASGYYVDLNVRVNSNARDGQRICNTASIRSAELPSPVSSNVICHVVKVPTTTTPTTPTTPSNPNNPVTPPIVITNPPIVVTPPPEALPVPPPAVPVSPSIQFAKSAVYLRRDGQTPAQLTDANGTTAGPGDVIEYTLKVLNSGTGPQDNQLINDDIHDILEYADVTSNGGGTLSGGAISWGTATIPANTTITKVFQVTVKSPVPSLPRSSSDIASYDLLMHNLFNTNEVNIRIQAPTAARQVEAASARLPQTGASTNLLVICAVAGLLVYFYSRNRLMIHETAILTLKQRG